MKRSLTILAGLALAVAAWAQAPFTIVRPADGAKVREVVRVQIPKGSIPEGSYVGIFVGGKFVEARILDLNGKFYEYQLDTKGRGIRDGAVKIEVVLYSDMGDRPRIVDRSSVTVNVANVVSIPIPDEGFLLRYKFVPKTELAYSVSERTSVSMISVNQARLGGRAAQLPIDADHFRMLYAVDNRYSDGDGLIRMQALPAKNKDFAILRTVGNPEGKKFMDYEMHPLYMRISNTGREEFGSVPMYVPLEGTGGEPSRTDLFASFPLPSLPEKRVKPGDTWQSGIHLGKLDLENLQELDSLTIKQGARGELVGVEWEMGHPCAKIRYTIAAGAPTGRPGAAGASGPQNANRDNIGDDRIQMDQTIWFALDRGVVLKSVMDVTRDVKAEGQAAAGGGNAPSGPTGSAAPGGGGRRGGGRMGGGGGAVGPVGGDRFQGRGPGAGASIGLEGGPQGGAGAGMGAGGRSGGGQAAAQLIRIRQQRVFVLEN
jgi:hypothetical protein